MSERERGNVWQGVRVALDELEAADVDPAALGDLLVLFAWASGGSVDGAINRGVRVEDALRASGWQAPQRDSDDTGGLDGIEHRLRRLADQFSETLGADLRDPDGARLRLRAEFEPVQARLDEDAP